MYGRRNKEAGREYEAGVGANGEGKRSVLMDFKIIRWNVMEMNDPNKRVIIKVGVREWEADLMCFHARNIHQT